MRKRFDEDELRALFEEVEAPPGVGRWRFRGAAPDRPPARSRLVLAMAACIVAVLAVVGGVTAAVRPWGAVPPSSLLSERPDPASRPATPPSVAIPSATIPPSSVPSGSAGPSSSPRPSRGGNSGGEQPGPHNTGVPDGTQLYQLDLADTTSFELPAANTSPAGCAHWNGRGEVVVDQDDCTVQGIDNPGAVMVTSRNAVVKNSRIHNSVGGGYPTNDRAYFAIEADRAANLQVIDSELSGGQHCIRGPSFSFLRVNAHGCGRAAHITGMATITDSWLHDIAGSGYVIFEDGAAGPVIVEGTYLDGTGPDVAAVIFASGGSRGHHTIRGCWLSGGEEMLVLSIGSATATVTDSYFYPTYTRTLIQIPAGGLKQSDNRWAASGTTPDRGRVTAGQALIL